MLRIPITMSHGIRSDGEKPLTPDHLHLLMGIAAEMGFQSINYDQLDGWYRRNEPLPPRPILFDFDHGVTSMLYQVQPILARFGFRGNLFVHTGPQRQLYESGKHLLPADQRQDLTWDELAQLRDLGWHIGAHTVTHPNLSKLSQEDPTGEKLRAELEGCDRDLLQHLGITARDFAYTGTSFSSAAEAMVQERYRFGRLWIVRSIYQADGKDVRYADLVGVPGPDEADTGPPMAARYITGQTPAYRLPSMEIQGLIHKPEAFRCYLESALA